ncbi:Glycosyltransferase involved in cell wall bisynthesis [Sphingobacterium nematocida]|uniref:Glycosyltransferase involved in cell wall bisynthesis n=1 Tax=Sphingobacterium nematocida TaxID=1513896 RepID=A0A1T5EXU7_9SPHI|nr:glycosyltransferase family A protein [Sphingobacterium nematocida]SKB88784.1 Glycosyltransferase involved in cell wall bisynthesis [Sphingobacterium nematocida]
MRNIKHTIIVLTYNQADLLPQCLNSILNNNVLPYEIIIGDDYSTDGTEELLENFRAKFPDIIKVYRSTANLGVFGNWNRLMSLVEGEIISLIAGDDFFKPDLLNSLNSLMYEKELNGYNDKFIIVTNSIELHPSGKERIYDNFQLRDKNIFKARIRYGLSYREVGLSRKLYDSLDMIDEKIGYHADWLYIIDQVFKSDKFYFLDKAFSVYRLGLGVTSKERKVALVKSKLKVIQIIRDRYKESLDSRDLKFLNYWEKRHEFLLNPTLNGYLKLFVFQFLNIGNFTPNNSFLLNARLLLTAPIRILLGNKAK